MPFRVGDRRPPVLLLGHEGGEAWDRQRSLLPVDTGTLLSTEISRVSKAMRTVPSPERYCDMTFLNSPQTRSLPPPFQPLSACHQFTSSLLGGERLSGGRQLESLDVRSIPLQLGEAGGVLSVPHSAATLFSVGEVGPWCQNT